MSNWDEIIVGKVGEKFYSGGTPSTAVASFWTGDIPWITSKWLNDKLYLENGEKFISGAAVSEGTTKIVPAGNLIFATRVGVGKVSINKIDLAINQDLLGIEIDKNRFDPAFIAYQLRSDSIQTSITSYKRGATIQGITKDNLKSLILRVPPLPEQRKIASVLSTVQNAIETQTKLIERTTELKKAMMHKLFTEGLRGEKQKMTEIGPVPESWEMAGIGKLFDIQQGKQVSKKNRIGNNQKYFLRTANVFWGYIDFSKLDSMHFTAEEEKKYKLNIDDLLVCEGGDIGRTAIIKTRLDNCYYQNHLHRLRQITENVFPLFFQYWLMYAIQNNIYFGHANVTTIPNLSSSRLKSFVVPLPSLKEQTVIANNLSQIDSIINLHINKKEKLEELFLTLLHKLITAEIRVNEIDFSFLEEKD